MEKACKKLIGMHDFMNFCKKDESIQISNTGFRDNDDEPQGTFIRRIYSFRIELVS
jgi:hypothetical protein